MPFVKISYIMLRLLRWLGELAHMELVGCCISYTLQLGSTAYERAKFAS